MSEKYLCIKHCGAVHVVLVGIAGPKQREFLNWPINS
jgi:hypothetical protein